MHLVNAVSRSILCTAKWSLPLNKGVGAAQMNVLKLIYAHSSGTAATWPAGVSKCCIVV